jgi:hypothetical protein
MNFTTIKVTRLNWLVTGLAVLMAVVAAGSPLF